VTVAWTAELDQPGWSDLVVRTVDVPPTPGDPQDPEIDVPSEQVTFPSWSDYLSSDASDVQTLVYERDLPGHGLLNDPQDVVVSDRPPGGRWSSSPVTVAREQNMQDSTQLAVNASGAAVVLWSNTKGSKDFLVAVHRPEAGAPWSAPARVPAPNAFSTDVDIDDAGRVLLIYDRISDNHEGVWAVRRSGAGVWGRPRHLSGRTTEWFYTAHGFGGTAVVTYGHVDGDGRSDGAQFTALMSPSGRWHAPVRHPDGYKATGSDVDAVGHALVTGRQGATLVARWVRPDGSWLRPFAIASGIERLSRVEVTLNRRGDALVVWSTQARSGQVWARYKPAGARWTKPALVTREIHPVWTHTSAIGDCGHVAVAWATRDHSIRVWRASPAP
jgi:hypothetical protein